MRAWVGGWVGGLVLAFFLCVLCAVCALLALIEWCPVGGFAWSVFGLGAGRPSLHVV